MEDLGGVFGFGMARSGEFFWPKDECGAVRSHEVGITGVGFLQSYGWAQEMLAKKHGFRCVWCSINVVYEFQKFPVFGFGGINWPWILRK